ncbi:PIN domain-containing protein [Bacillus paranthracis]
MKQKISALFDTSVLFGHTCRQFIFDAAYENLCECYWSPHIIGELYRTVTAKKLKKLGFGHEKILSESSKKMMDIMEPCFYCVNSYSNIHLNLKKFIKDKDDFHLYQAAVLKRVDYIVTNNGSDLNGVKFDLEKKGIKVVDYEEFETIISIRAQSI